MDEIQFLFFQCYTTSQIKPTVKQFIFTLSVTCYDILSLQQKLYN